MCNDSFWSKLLKAASTAVVFETDRIATSYMLQTDALVSNINSGATDPNNGEQWIQEGPHIM
jgi:hypothetical protein